MWIQNCFKSLTSTSRRRRPIRRRPAAGRLQVESLEDRCLLSFGLPVDYGVGLAAQGLVSADFNGDGRLDLATAIRDDHTVRVLLGNGDGTFQAARTSGTAFLPEISCRTLRPLLPEPCPASRSGLAALDTNPRRSRAHRRNPRDS